MKLKNGVKLDNLKTQTLVAMLVAKDLFALKGFPFTITSVSDGKHMDGSLHYKGAAFDVSTSNISVSNRRDVLTSIKSVLNDQLGGDFDVVLEDLGGPNEHLHIEYDPKPKAISISTGSAMIVEDSLKQ